jgi:cephalosporin-C deacetylase
VFEGVSFAGGLALMAQAVTGESDLLAIGVPTFGWAEGRNLFVRSGSGAEISRYLERRPDHVEDTMVVLRYFDAVNFADRVSCPTLLALGLEDNVVPAKTVYGIANHLKVPYELMEFPVSHSDGPEEEQWAQFEAYWLRLALQGLPVDFGA